MSEILAATGDLDGARKVVTNAYNQSKQSDDALLIALTAGQRANVELISNHFEEAEAFYTESLSYETATPMGALLGWFEMGLSVCLMNRDAIVEAEKYLTKGLNSGRAVGDKSIILSAFLVFASFAQKTGNMQRMARLVGAAEVLLKLSGYNLWNVSRKMYQELKDGLAQVPDQVMVDQQRKIGMDYPLEQAIGFAIGKLG